MIIKNELEALYAKNYYDFRGFTDKDLRAELLLNEELIENFTKDLSKYDGSSIQTDDMLLAINSMAKYQLRQINIIRELKIRCR